MSKASKAIVEKPGLVSEAVRLLVMVQKEWLELLRSFKLVWVPLVFIVLGIMQPVVSYYMPIIMKSAGNLPEGAVIEIPVPSAGEVLAQTLSQYGSVGLLVLVLVFMGTVSGERNSGAAALILVKPVSTQAFIVSKWISMLTLSIGALAVGYLSAWYYTNLLIDKSAFGPFIASMAVYGLWIMFIMTVTLLFSTLLRSGAASAFSALGLAVLLTLLTSLFPKQLGWSPGALPGIAYGLAAGADIDTGKMLVTLAVAFIFIIALLTAAVIGLRRSPAID